MGETTHRLKILFLPAWYPTEANPVLGIFVKEHAKAASLYNDVVVLYVFADEAMPFWWRCQATEEVEGGIRTVRVKYGRYWPIAASLKRLLFPGKLRASARGSSSPKGWGFLRTLKALLTIDGIVVGDVLYYWRVLSAFQKVLRAGWRPDVIHAHVFTAGVPAVILGRVHRIPVVITEHWSGFPLRKLTAPDRVKARFALNRADIILPVSDDLKCHIESYGIRGRSEVVPNAVNGEVFFPSPSRSQEGRNRSKRLLLVAGLLPVKGVPYLLQALSHLRRERQDFVLDIVGDGPNRGEYEVLAGELGLDRVVEFHGLKRKTEVAHFMRDCDFYVQPSLWENLPCVLIEATACGKPVVASDVGGIREIIDQGNGVLVSSRDVRALEDAISYMLDNHQNYSSEEIAERAGERFRYETVGKVLNRVYSELSAR